jgi:hypothetical protein
MGSLMDRLNAPMKIRQERFGHAPGSNLLLGIYTHTVEEDDRLVAEQLGEMLCPNVAKFGTRENLRRERRRGDSVG